MHIAFLFVGPKQNVATTDLSACVIEGVSRNRNALINGKKHVLFPVSVWS